MRDWLARWVEAERGRFILFLPVAMGAAICGYFGLATEPPPWVGPVGSGVALLALIALWRRRANSLPLWRWRPRSASPGRNCAPPPSRR